MEFALEFERHGFGLRDDHVSATVGERIGIAREAAPAMDGERGGERSILPDHDSGLRRQEWAKRENQQIKVCDAGEDKPRTEPPDQAKQFEDAAMHASGAKFVDGDGRGQGARGVLRARDEGEMDVVLVGIEGAGEGFDDSFGSAATEVRDQEKDPWMWWR
jgi:hypothetical protein